MHFTETDKTYPLSNFFLPFLLLPFFLFYLFCYFFLFWNFYFWKKYFIYNYIEYFLVCSLGRYDSCNTWRDKTSLAFRVLWWYSGNDKSSSTLPFLSNLIPQDPNRQIRLFKQHHFPTLFSYLDDPAIKQKTHRYLIWLLYKSTWKGKYTEIFGLKQRSSISGSPGFTSASSLFSSSSSSQLSWRQEAPLVILFF